MQTDVKDDFGATLAKIFSVIFHPLLMPVYGLAIIFSAPTLFGYLPFNVKKLFMLIVLVNNVFLPVSLMPFLYHRGVITTWTLDDRRERLIPLLLTTLLYGATSVIIFRFPLPLFLKTFLYGAFFLSAVVTLINLRWKISIHAVAAGALIAMVLILSFRMYTPLVWHFISVVVISGIVLSSRLKLNNHNPLQVWFGLFTGFAGLILFMVFLKYFF
jgi:hypothetical protein